MKTINIIISIIFFAMLALSCSKGEVTPEMKTKAEAFNQEGLELFSKGSFEDALSKFKDASKANPQNPEYPNNMGNCYLQTNKLKEAKVLFEQAISMRKDIPMYYFNLGMALLNMKNDDEALKNMEKAASLDEKYYSPWLYTGIIYYKQKIFDKAETAWKKASSITENPEVENNLGMLYLETGRLDEAERRFNKAIKLDNRYPLAFYNLGVLYQKQKKYSDADTNYQQAIILNPENYTPYYNRAIVLGELGKNKEAIESLEKFLKYCPKDLSGPIQGAKKRIGELKKKV